MMTGQLIATPELWRLSLLTGHLLAQGRFIFGHRSEDESISWIFTAVQLVIFSLLVFAVCSETLSDGIRFVAKPAVDITFV